MAQSQNFPTQILTLSLTLSVTLMVSLCDKTTGQFEVVKLHVATALKRQAEAHACPFLQRTLAFQHIFLLSCIPLSQKTHGWLWLQLCPFREMFQVHLMFRCWGQNYRQQTVWMELTVWFQCYSPCHHLTSVTLKTLYLCIRHAET